MKLAEANGAQAYHLDWRGLLGVVPSCDLLCVDAPYSAKTHAGHDDAVASTRLDGEEARLRTDRRNGSVYSVGVNRRRTLSYEAWDVMEVNDFVSAWTHRVRGWFVSITDHTLAPVWSEALASEGRYVFAPLPFYSPGSTVRLTGDGPSSWTAWIVVARPKTRQFSMWGTLPGGYVLPPGQGGDLPVVGGKPVWLMQRLIEDYSRAGDLVVDPCMGAGTTLVGAIRAGRRAIGGDVLLDHAQLAAQWIRHPMRPAPTIEREVDSPQRRLF